jgi:LysM repeat protein
MIDNGKLKDLSVVKTAFVYMVEKDETVFTLAKKFHTTVEVIVKTNGLTEDIKRGQFLLIERVDGVEYFVKPKDTIFKIANYSDEKRTEIVSKNKIDYVYVGQKIYI